MDIRFRGRLTYYFLTTDDDGRREPQIHKIPNKSILEIAQNCRYSVFPTSRSLQKTRANQQRQKLAFFRPVRVVRRIRYDVNLIIVSHILAPPAPKNIVLSKTMLASTVSVARRRFPASVRSQAKRGLSTQPDKSEGPIGKDGRHELWREGINDHDNEPK